MKGSVFGINGDRCAVKIDTGITLFRIQGTHSTEVGDIISGNLDALGSEPLFNETKKERLRVFIARWGCSKAGADKYLNP